MRPTVEEIAGDSLPAIAIMLSKMEYMLIGTCTVRVIYDDRKPTTMSFLCAYPLDKQKPKLAVYVSGPWWDSEGKESKAEYEIYELNARHLTVMEDSRQSGTVFWSWREPGCYNHEPITMESIEQSSVNWLTKPSPND